MKGMLCVTIMYKVSFSVDNNHITKQCDRPAVVVRGCGDVRELWFFYIY